jgi:hypothetical protein
MLRSCDGDGRGAGLPHADVGVLSTRVLHDQMTQHLASLHISNTAEATLEATLDAKALNRALHHHLS